MTPCSVAACFVFAASVAWCQTPFDSIFERADKQIIRLAPSRFPQLPSSIRATLNRRGCTIPQVWGEYRPHNVIRGSFIQEREVDWAVLCSVDRISNILVFQNASASHAIEFGREADIDRLQGIGGTQIGYSREITPAGRKQIHQYQAWGGERSSPIPIHHQGIEDAFVGKGSVVFYFYRGKWLQLTGAD